MRRWLSACQEKVDLSGWYFGVYAARMVTVLAEVQTFAPSLVVQLTVLSFSLSLAMCTGTVSGRSSDKKRDSSAGSSSY
jgi:hypothetical protein